MASRDGQLDKAMRTTKGRRVAPSQGLAFAITLAGDAGRTRDASVPKLRSHDRQAPPEKAWPHHSRMNANILVELMVKHRHRMPTAVLYSSLQAPLTYTMVHLKLTG